MGPEIKSWQIIDGKLCAVDVTMKDEGRTETKHLEPWLESNPELIGADIVIIGRQIQTNSGPIDLLGIDKAGNTVIIELKRDKLPRESLAQAIDYASDVAEWTVDRLSAVCFGYRKKSLDEFFGESFPDVDLESVNLNNTQRIILVGFSIESQLERMIEWLSDRYAVNVNAVVLSYVKTKGGDELLTKTSIISEEAEIERAGKRKFKIPMSDEPGVYDSKRLKPLLVKFLTRDKVTNQRIRDILLPACMKKNVVTRDQLEKEFIEFDPEEDESKVGYYISLISVQLGLKKNDFLRQVVEYSYPKHHWKKDNFSIRAEYRDLVKEILKEIKGK